MAAQSKTTAVHFSLIFFVMLSVILGVVAYLFYADFRENEAKYVKMKQESDSVSGVNRQYQTEKDELKKVIGINLDEVGVLNPIENSVLQQSSAAIKTLGKNPAANDFVTALRDLREQFDKQTTELGERQATIAQLQADLTALRSQYETVSNEHDTKRRGAEQDLASEQTKFGESIVSKDKELANLRGQLNTVQTELAQSRERYEAQLNDLNSKNTELVAINEKLNRRLEQETSVSFEVADGQITRVDQVSRTVWVNLGFKDGLKKRTTFSVYPSLNAGIGREDPNGGRAEDIKGSIEVIEVLNDKLSVARILDDTSANPISPGDLIFSPLWGSGRTEKFAFVGMIDIDGDGSTVGDRERMHEVLSSVGAEISAEVTDQGELIGGPITEQTRFLVMGNVPDFVQEPDAQRKAELKRMAELKKEMEETARRQGVRIINLNQFLDFIGYVPQRRLWVPGTEGNFPLQAGGLSSMPKRAVDPRTRVSTGNTSGLFSPRGKANSSGTGNTSQLFKGRGVGTGSGY